MGDFLSKEFLTTNVPSYYLITLFCILLILLLLLSNTSHTAELLSEIRREIKQGFVFCYLHLKWNYIEYFNHILYAGCNCTGSDENFTFPKFDLCSNFSRGLRLIPAARGVGAAGGQSTEGGGGAGHIRVGHHPLARGAEPVGGRSAEGGGGGGGHLSVVISSLETRVEGGRRRIHLSGSTRLDMTHVQIRGRMLARQSTNVVINGSGQLQEGRVVTEAIIPWSGEAQCSWAEGRFEKLTERELGFRFEETNGKLNAVMMHVVMVAVCRLHHKHWPVVWGGVRANRSRAPGVTPVTMRATLENSLESRNLPHFLLDGSCFDISRGREKLSGGGQVTMCSVHRYNNKYSAEGGYITQGEGIGESPRLILTREHRLHDTVSWSTLHCPSF